MFERYVGIDYSGAETSLASLPGLRIYMAEGDSRPIEILPQPSPRKYWTRAGVATWLEQLLRGGPPTLAGIDHAFSFPLQYFESHLLSLDWDRFLDDFCTHWPTNEPHVYVDSVREGVCGNGEARKGNSKWKRLTERRTGSAKSVFHFDVPGSVAKSTHAGLPWLRRLRRSTGQFVHFWPFDGWEILPGKSAVVEVYPRLWNQSYPREGRTPDQHDAFCVAETLAREDANGRLATLLHPRLTGPEQAFAEIEGWILGVS